MITFMNVLINGVRAKTETCITIEKDDIKLQNESHKRERYSSIWIERENPV